MNIFLKIHKRIVIFLLILVLIFLGIVYKSKTTLYKESDFDINYDSFKTLNFDKDPYSEENGFIDLVKLEQGLGHESDLLNHVTVYADDFLDDNIDLSLISGLGDCFLKENEDLMYTCEKEIYDIFIVGKTSSLKSGFFKEGLSYNEVEEKLKEFDDNYFKKEYAKTKIQSLIGYKKFIGEKSLEFTNIINKDFISQTPEYLGLSSESLSFYNLKKYFNSTAYISYIDFNNGNLDKGIDLLLDNQKFIDYIINNGDFGLFLSLYSNTLNNINVLAINNLLDNYELTNDQLSKLLDYFENNPISENFIHNGVIHDTNAGRINESIDDVSLSMFESSSLIGKIKNSIVKKLFFSKEDLIALKLKFASDRLTNGKYDDEMYSEMENYKLTINNIGNSIGRSIIIGMVFKYDAYPPKEEKRLEDRKNISEKINKIREEREVAKVEEKNRILNALSEK